MRIISAKKRSDGKNLVRLVFTNGVTLNKIVTDEQLAAWRAEAAGAPHVTRDWHGQVERTQ